VQTVRLMAAVYRHSVALFAAPPGRNQGTQMSAYFKFLFYPNSFAGLNFVILMFHC
jgi:hypothetical protein